MRILAMFLLILAGTSAQALACSCAPSSRQETIDQADIVFTGKVEKVERDGFWNIATLHVNNVSKGTLGEQAKVTTGAQTASCGINFAVGETMEIAAIQRKDRLQADLCSQLGLKE